MSNGMSDLVEGIKKLNEMDQNWPEPFWNMPDQEFRMMVMIHLAYIISKLDKLVVSKGG